MKCDATNRYKVKRGVELPQSKLTDDDVRNIRALVEYREKVKRELAGLTNAALAEKFDIHTRSIEKIVARETWGHVQ